MAKSYDISQFQSDVEVGPDVQTDYGREKNFRSSGSRCRGSPNPCMKILVIGKTGAGKSSLINVFFGREVAKERDCVTPQQDKTIEIHRGNVAGIDVTMVDTRGLGDSDIKASF